MSTDDGAHDAGGNAGGSAVPGPSGTTSPSSPGEGLGAPLTFSPANLRRRSAQTPDTDTAGTGVGSSSSPSSASMGRVPAQSVATPSAPGALANRRPAVGNRMQSQADAGAGRSKQGTQPNAAAAAAASLSHTALRHCITRATSPAPSISSTLASPLNRDRTPHEAQAMADMKIMNAASLASVSALHRESIQRPASAPPRAIRSRRFSRDQEPKYKPSRDGDDTHETIAIDEMERASLDGSDYTSASISEIASDTIERFAAHLSDRSLALLFIFVVGWGAVLALDRLTIYSYHTLAVDTLSHHSSLAVLNAMRAIVSLLATGPISTIAELSGRANTFTSALLLYAAGHAFMASSRSIGAFALGVGIYEVGACALISMQGAVLADMTSSHNRAFFQIIPQMPVLVFSFISSDVFSAITPKWRFGLALSAVLGPAALAPVIFILGKTQRTYKGPALSSTQSLGRATLQQTESPTLYAVRLVWHLVQIADLAGLSLLASAVAAVCVPLGLGALSSHIGGIAILIVFAGTALLVAFVWWELRRAEHPILLRAIIRDRSFWAGTWSIALMWTSYTLASTYYPTFLYVVKGVSPRAQQNFSVIFSFTVAVASVPIALVVRHTKRFKAFAAFGTIIFIRGLGIMVKFGPHSMTSFQIASSQVMMGVGSALTVALIQTAVRSSYPAAMQTKVISALALFSSLGYAAGAALAGDLWTRLLPTFLVRELASTGHVRDLSTIYAEPLTFITSYPIGTTTRVGIVAAYTTTWRVMITVATVISGASLLALFVMKSPESSGESVDVAQAKGLASRRGSITSLTPLQETSESDDKSFQSHSRRSSVCATPPLMPVQIASVTASPSSTPRRSRSRANSHASTPDSSLRMKSILHPFGPARRQMRPGTDEEEDFAELRTVSAINDRSATQLPRYGTPVPRQTDVPLEEMQTSHAPTLIIDEAPFHPPSCPPTPPGLRPSLGLRPLSPLQPRQS